MGLMLMHVPTAGIGDVARRACTPVLGTRGDVELHYCFRDAAVLMDAGRCWRSEGLHRYLRAALKMGRLEAAFIHLANPPAWWSRSECSAFDRVRAVSRVEPTP